MTIVAHTPITADFTTTGEHDLQDDEAPKVTIQHDPCNEGTVCIGVNADGVRMDVADLYVTPTNARLMAHALLAAAEHATRRCDFQDEPDRGTDEQWAEEHARALVWVAQNPHVALIEHAR